MKFSTFILIIDFILSYIIEYNSKGKESIRKGMIHFNYLYQFYFKYFIKLLINSIKQDKSIQIKL